MQSLKQFMHRSDSAANDNLLMFISYIPEFISNCDQILTLTSGDFFFYS